MSLMAVNYQYAIKWKRKPELTYDSGYAIMKSIKNRMQRHFVYKCGMSFRLKEMDNNGWRENNEVIIYHGS